MMDEFSISDFIREMCDLSPFSLLKLPFGGAPHFQTDPYELQSISCGARVCYDILVLIIDSKKYVAYSLLHIMCGSMTRCI